MLSRSLPHSETQFYLLAKPYINSTNEGSKTIKNHFNISAIYLRFR
nr:MAG TPA: hypothetical protein [Caudoviricetes sp.]